MTKRYVAFDRPRRAMLRSSDLSRRSLRSKAQSQGGFRFFDLPPELRNKIYRLVSASWTHCNFHLNNHVPKTIAQVACIQPALLRSSKRLGDEAGVYYFGCGEFTITFHRTDINHLLLWLRSIGKLNVTRLLFNPNVTLRLLLEWGSCSRSCSTDTAFTLSALRKIHTSQVQKLSQITDCINVAVASLAFERWTFTLECPRYGGHHRYWMHEEARRSRGLHGARDRHTCPAVPTLSLLLGPLHVI